MKCRRFRNVELQVEAQSKMATRKVNHNVVGSEHKEMSVIQKLAGYVQMSEFCVGLQASDTSAAAGSGSESP